MLPAVTTTCATSPPVCCWRPRPQSGRRGSAHTVNQKSPIDFAVKSTTDPRILSAILNAPSFLSGLNEAEWNLVRDRARQALHPEHTDMEKQLTQARDELRKGFDATKRVLLERCEMREDDDGQFRSVREPSPAGILAAATNTAKPAAA